MNKETVSYIKHIMGSEFVRLDVLNVLLAAGVISVSFIAFITGRVMLFSVVFLIGAVLAFFNAVKTVKKKSVLGTVVFAVMALVLAFASFFVFRYLGAR